MGTNDWVTPKALQIPCLPKFLKASQNPHIESEAFKDKPRPEYLTSFCFCYLVGSQIVSK